jgi:competence protein ComEA
MTKRWLTTGVLATVWIVSAVTMSARQEPAQTVLLVPSGEGLPEGPGKDVMVRSCGTCHEAKRAASTRLTRAGWAAVIDSMIGRGAQIRDAEVPVVLEYLSTHFLGEAAQPININTAPQVDFEAAVGLLRREAAAVIAYRNRHGRFASVDDLKKVPGVDPRKIEARRAAMVVLQ